MCLRCRVRWVSANGLCSRCLARQRRLEAKAKRAEPSPDVAEVDEQEEGDV